MSRNGVESRTVATRVVIGFSVVCSEVLAIMIVVIVHFQSALACRGLTPHSDMI